MKKKNRIRVCLLILLIIISIHYSYSKQIDAFIIQLQEIITQSKECYNTNLYSIQLIIAVNSAFSFMTFPMRAFSFQQKAIHKKPPPSQTVRFYYLISSLGWLYCYFTWPKLITDSLLQIGAIFLAYRYFFIRNVINEDQT